ncbi:hypothetical protein GCM10023195_69200 [Actinoallomurus liliacearum]|uniref:DUF2867 domain-containing protein n=1 Tax=Actinoallomurus liliacearum TaxID=1080073 RepID=A0ABP8TW52_9ACTN
MDWILDRLVPTYDFRSRYTRRIAASPEAVWAALHAVTAAELPVTRLLMGVRSAGRSRMSGPMAEVLSTNELGRQEGREAVGGIVAKFWRLRPAYGPEETADPAGFASFAEPGWAKAAMAFQLSPAGEDTLLATETRIRATDGASRRAFGRYWLLIRAGSGVIRFEFLRAIARRAESTR